MLEEGLYLFITGNLPLLQVISPTNSVFMGYTPENAANPSIMLEKVSAVNDTTMDGPSGFVIRRYQFTCAAKDTAAPGSGFVIAQRVADVLRKQLDGLTGTLPDGTLVFNAIRDNELDSYDADAGVYHAIVDYFIHFRQAQ